GEPYVQRHRHGPKPDAGFIIRAGPRCRMEWDDAVDGQLDAQLERERPDDSRDRAGRTLLGGWIPVRPGSELQPHPRLYGPGPADAAGQQFRQWLGGKWER